MFSALVSAIGLLILSSIILLLLYLPGIKYGFNLADEGYLWHGSVQTLKRKVPIRDFRAYDLGRYYWCAFWMFFLGHELLSLRICLMITRIIGLCFAIMTMSIVEESWYVVVVSAILVGLWMHPRHKQMDILISIVAIFLVVSLIYEPNSLHYFLSGIFVGLFLLVGLNHLLYTVSGFLLLLSIMRLHDYGLEYIDSFGLFLGGLLLSIIVIFFIFILIPRFFKIYWELKVMTILRRKNTNLALPVPWIWNKQTVQLNQYTKVTQLLIKFMFTIMPLVYGTILLMAIFGNTPATLKEWSILATASIGLFYFHHAISRADFSHLAQAIFPFLLTLIFLFNESIIGFFLLLFMAAISWKYIYAVQENAIHKVLLPSDNLTHFNIKNNHFLIQKGQANLILRLTEFVEKYSKEDDFVLMLPTLVGLYPLCKREAPVYDIFCVYKASLEEERCMITELEISKAPVAIINNIQLDGKEELRFSNTHTELWKYVNEKYQRVDSRGILPPHIYLFTKTWI